MYSLLAMVAARRYLAVRPPPLKEFEPVSILKPLAGLDLDLESNLRTFFEQDYPDFEILFAVRQADDPAAQVAARLANAFTRTCRSRILDSSASRLTPTRKCTAWIA